MEWPVGSSGVGRGKAWEKYKLEVVQLLKNTVNPTSQVRTVLGSVHRRLFKGEQGALYDGSHIGTLLQSQILSVHLFWSCSIFSCVFFWPEENWISSISINDGPFCEILPIDIRRKHQWSCVWFANGNLHITIYSNVHHKVAMLALCFHFDGNIFFS